MSSFISTTEPLQSSRSTRGLAEQKHNCDHLSNLLEYQTNVECLEKWPRPRMQPTSSWASSIAGHVRFVCFPNFPPHCSARTDYGVGRCIEDIHPVLYSNYRATVTFSYTIHAVLSFMSMVAVQRAIDTGIEASSSALSVGQIISMVVALAIAVRVLWLVSRAIYVERKNLDCLCRSSRLVLEFFAQYMGHGCPLE